MLGHRKGIANYFIFSQVHELYVTLSQGEKI